MLADFDGPSSEGLINTLNANAGQSFRPRIRIQHQPLCARGAATVAIMNPLSLDLDLGLKGRSVLVTGGAGLIGSVVVDHFLAAGSKVSSLDIAYSRNEFHEPDPARPQLQRIYCDVSSEDSIQEAFTVATQTHGPVEVCIALASLDLSVLEPAAFADASLDQLQRVLNVNVAGTWLTARAWFQGLRQAKQDGIALAQHPNLIIIGSESGHFGERANVEYSLAKSAVQGGLLMSLRAEAPRVWPGARVNVVAPGPVETDRWYDECKLNPDQRYLEAQATVILTSHVSSRVLCHLAMHTPSPSETAIFVCGSPSLIAADCAVRAYSGQGGCNDDYVTRKPQF